MLRKSIRKWGSTELSECGFNSWLYKSDTNQWTLTPVSDSRMAEHVSFVDGLRGLNSTLLLARMT